MRESYRCLKCKNIILYDNKNNILCPNCGFKAPIISGIPVFIPVESIKNDVSKLGFGEKLFSNPRLYNFFVDLKSHIFPDSRIGVDDYIKGKDVLDVGCGPSFHHKYLEYLMEDTHTITAVDISLPFVMSARAENPDEKFDFAVASVGNLPFPDKSFDTAIISFVIHHVPVDEIPIMDELIRVTKNHIIIYDHLRSNKRIASAVQLLYWNIMDGGCNYLSDEEWLEFLSAVNVVKRIRTGAIFGHVVKYVCSIN